MSSSLGPNVHVDPTAVIGDKVSLNAPGTHSITIGAHAIIHPFVKLHALHGPIVVGTYAVIWEKAQLGQRPVGNEDETTGETGSDGKRWSTQIGDSAVLGSGTVIQAGAHVGSNTHVDVGVEIQAGAMIGDWCKIASKVQVWTGEQIPDWTVLRGGGSNRIQRTYETAKEDERVRRLAEKGHQSHVSIMSKMLKGK